MTMTDDFFNLSASKKAEVKVTYLSNHFWRGPGSAAISDFQVPQQGCYCKGYTDGAINNEALSQCQLACSRLTCQLRSYLPDSGTIAGQDLGAVVAMNPTGCFGGGPGRGGSS